jgi:hypothetical protein
MFGHTSMASAVVLASALAVAVTAAPAFASAPRHAEHAHHASQHGKRHRKRAHRRPAPLPCRAEMSNPDPREFSTTDVVVTTAPRAMAEATARYLISMVHEAAFTSTHGAARIPYYISLSTPGYRVSVNVIVTAGDRSGSCTTSFIPRLS